MNCPDCGEKMSRDNTKVYAWHCPKCNDDYKDDYVMGYWKGYADAKYAAQHHAHLTPESLASSQAVSNASALEPLDDDTRPAQAQVA